MLDIITKNDKYLNTVLNILFTIITVNKDLKYKFTPERERSINCYNFPGKNS